ncbi:hypothetical protein [Xanthomonas bonasiae]|uniref:hypothetical protein n=1 Tax=Xanthomonas bonasiae TaxID=2810351 RepID=UPI001CD8B418|nr:hypothetical protein [Xanthomonas surreyensis]
MSVEQFLGRSLEHTEYVRHVELRPAKGGIEVWVHDVEDIGNEDYLDLYDFPYLEPDGPDAPVALFADPQDALAYASTSLAADPAHWVNQGIVQSEYLDYIRAGRPAKWPEASRSVTKVDAASRAGP